jgi:hypothetical protein
VGKDPYPASGRRSSGGTSRRAAEAVVSCVMSQEVVSIDSHGHLRVVGACPGIWTKISSGRSGDRPDWAPRSPEDAEFGASLTCLLSKKGVDGKN